MKASDLTEQQKTTDDVIEIGEILRRLPHRYPFLLIDRAVGTSPTNPFAASRTSPSTSRSFRSSRRAGDARRAADRGVGANGRCLDVEDAGSRYHQAPHLVHVGRKRAFQKTRHAGRHDGDVRRSALPAPQHLHSFFC